MHSMWKLTFNIMLLWQGLGCNVVPGPTFHFFQLGFARWFYHLPSSSNCKGQTVRWEYRTVSAWWQRTWKGTEYWGQQQIRYWYYSGTKIKASHRMQSVNQCLAWRFWYRVFILMRSLHRRSKVNDALGQDQDNVKYFNLICNYSVALSTVWQNIPVMHFKTHKVVL